MKEKPIYLAFDIRGFKDLHATLFFLGKRSDLKDLGVKDTRIDGWINSASQAISIFKEGGVVVMSRDFFNPIEKAPVAVARLEFVKPSVHSWCLSVRKEMFIELQQMFAEVDANPELLSKYPAFKYRDWNPHITDQGVYTVGQVLTLENLNIRNFE